MVRRAAGVEGRMSVPIVAYARQYVRDVARVEAGVRRRGEVHRRQDVSLDAHEISIAEQGYDCVAWSPSDAADSRQISKRTKCGTPYYKKLNASSRVGVLFAPSPIPEPALVKALNDVD